MRARRCIAQAHWRELASTLAFDDIDLDGNGVVDRSEIAAAYERKHGHPAPDVLLDAMMALLNKDPENTSVARAEYEAFAK